MLKVKASYFTYVTNSEPSSMYHPSIVRMKLRHQRRCALYKMLKKVLFQVGEMIPEGNLDLLEGIKSIRNGIYLDNYKNYVPSNTHIV